MTWNLKHTMWMSTYTKMGFHWNWGQGHVMKSEIFRATGVKISSSMTSLSIGKLVEKIPLHQVTPKKELLSSRYPEANVRCPRSNFSNLGFAITSVGNIELNWNLHMHNENIILPKYLMVMETEVKDHVVKGQIFFRSVMFQNSLQMDRPILFKLWEKWTKLCHCDPGTNGRRSNVKFRLTCFLDFKVNRNHLFLTENSQIIRMYSASKMCSYHRNWNQL